MPHFTSEQQEQMKQDLFPSHIIGDYNSEGYDSCESEDFDPGFGCVPLKKKTVLAPPPPVPKKSIMDMQADAALNKYLKERL